MEPIKCKNCPSVIELLPGGFWVTYEGFAYCKKRVGNEAPMLHEPIVTDEWRTEIKRLMGTSPKLWTVDEVSRLMQLPSNVIQEILDS